MKKDLKGILAIALISILALSACSKSSNSTNNSTAIVGNWTLVKTASDSNHNGKADAGEWVDFSSSISGAVASVNVKTGGKGNINIVYMGVPVLNDSFTWSVNGNYVTLNISDTTLLSVQSGSEHIDSLTDHVCVLKDTTGGMASWLYMTK